MVKNLQKIFNETKRWMIAALALPAMALLIWLGIHFIGTENTRHIYALIILSTFAVVSTCWWWWAMSRFHKVTQYIISTNDRFDDILNDIREIKEDIGTRKRPKQTKSKDRK